MEKSVPTGIQDQNRVHNVNSRPRAHPHTQLNPQFQLGFVPQSSTQFHAPTNWVSTTITASGRVTATSQISTVPTITASDLISVDSTITASCRISTDSTTTVSSRISVNTAITTNDISTILWLSISNASYTNEIRTSNYYSFNGSYDQWETFRDSFKSMIPDKYDDQLLRS